MCEIVGSNPTDPTTFESAKFESLFFHTLWEVKKARYAESTCQRLRLNASILDKTVLDKLYWLDDFHSTRAVNFNVNCRARTE